MRKRERRLRGVASGRRWGGRGNVGRKLGGEGEENASFFRVRGLHGESGGLAVSFFSFGKVGRGFLDHVLAVLDDIDADGRVLGGEGVYG